MKPTAPAVPLDGDRFDQLLITPTPSAPPPFKSIQILVEFSEGKRDDAEHFYKMATEAMFGEHLGACGNSILATAVGRAFSITNNSNLPLPKKRS